MSYRVAVLGATGTVGREILKILAEREFPVTSVYALASDKTIKRQVSFGEEKVLDVIPAHTFDFSKVDIVFASPGTEASKIYGPRAAQAGALYIDNSSAFRMQGDVPLIVPEVNPQALSLLKDKRIIASPNCVALPLTVALKPLHDIAPIKRIVASTYQSVSGAGKAAMSELMNQTKSTFMSDKLKKEVFPKQIAFNIFPHIGNFDADGYLTEENKIAEETKKILSAGIQIAVTSVRVPTFIGHALSVNVEFMGDISVAQARKALKTFPGVQLYDDVEEEKYITPIECAGHDDVFVSRVRKDPSCPHGLILWIVADNLRKGAALNTVQIAELWVKNQKK